MERADTEFKQQMSQDTQKTQHMQYMQECRDIASAFLIPFIDIIHDTQYTNNSVHVTFLHYDLVDADIDYDTVYYKTLQKHVQKCLCFVYKNAQDIVELTFSELIMRHYDAIRTDTYKIKAMAVEHTHYYNIKDSDTSS